MVLLNNMIRRSMSFGFAALILMTVGTGDSAVGNHDDLHEASSLSVSTFSAPDYVQAMPTNCLPDGNEPNEYPSQATLLTSSQIDANFHSPTDVDWYRYNATGGTRLETGANGHYPYVLEVYSESTGNLVTSGVSWLEDALGSNSYANVAYWYAPESASYLIKVAYPAQAAGLHACDSSHYYTEIYDHPGVPAGETFQINGLVYHDDNWSADWQIEEPVIDSVTVRLLNPNGAIVATKLTDSNGVFQFTDLPEGWYVVEQTDVSGYVSTTSNRVIVSLSNDKVVYFGDYYLPTRGSLQFLPLQLKQH